MSSIDEQVKASFSVAIRAGLFSLGASVLVGALLMTRSGVNSTSDVVPFTFWTVLFAWVMALISPLAIPVFSRLPRLLSYPLAVILGVLASFCYGVGVSLFLIFGTFSFPVGFAWTAGGIGGLVAVAGVGSRARTGNFLLELVLVGVVCLSLAFGGDAFVIAISGDRHLEIVWVKWKPGTEPAVLEKRLTDYLTEEEVTHLRAMNLSGSLIWKGTGSEGRGQRSRVVLIMQHQLGSSIELPLPERWVIYVQEQNGWRKEPPDAVTVRKTLGLEIDPGSPQRTQLVWREPFGTSRFGGFDWSESGP